MIKANLKHPDGTKCIIYFKTVNDGKDFSKWLDTTLKSVYQKGVKDST
jgi:hypothetical protein